MFSLSNVTLRMAIIFFHSCINTYLLFMIQFDKIHRIVILMDCHFLIF